MPARAQVGAYLLAGGRSQRMGSPKHRLEWSGASIVAHLAAMAAPHVAGVWIVGKRGQGLETHGLPVLYDDDDASAALVHGIRTALVAPGPAWRWLLACDMPGVDAAVLADLWQAAHRARARGAAPAQSPGGDPEPLPSLWHAGRCAGQARAAVGSAKGWVEQAELARWIVPSARRDCLVNLNTVEEWNAWRRRHDASPF
jgi:molybdopterin-guanine dinucleotide biosynthesis protein A